MQLQEDILRLLDAMPMGVHIIDKDGIVQRVNRSWLMQFGRSFEDVLGKPLGDVMKDLILFNAGPYRVDNPWEMLEPAALKVLETGFPQTATYNRGTCTAVARPITDDAGNIQYVMTSYVDNRAKGDYALISSSSDTQQVSLLGESEAMRRISEVLDLISTTDVSVLIIGESGTGKEVLADELVRRSERHNKPFIKINCAAIPESLFESELFGYEKGSFTGALKSGKEGFLEAADTGTILLDEIGEMPLSMQPKLLRVIQEKAITRVGGTTSIPVDVRILATTNKNLSEMVRKGTFREDLYYRLNVIPIRVPRLCEREGDVRLIGSAILMSMSDKYHKYAKITEEGWDYLERYDWPGNVRQLRNLMERITVLRGNREVTLSELQMLLQDDVWDAVFTESKEIILQTQPVSAIDVSGQTLQEATDRLQEQMIRDALLKHKTTYHAAEALGISQPTFVRKAKKYGITGTDETESN